MTDISIIIVSYNSEKTVEETLQSVSNQSIDSNRYETIVVDGGSSDSTVEICKKYSDAVLVSEGSGIGKCRNLGIEEASCDLIAFTDSDCRVPFDWLEKHERTLRSADSSIAGVGGPNVPFPSDNRFSKVVGCFQKTLFGSGGSPQSYDIQGLREVESVPACNSMYRKNVLDRIKFDPDVNVGEDAELNYRIRSNRLGIVYNPDNYVYHHLSTDLYSFYRKNQSYGEAMAKIQTKHRDLIRWYSPLPSAVLILLPFLFKTMRELPARKRAILSAGLFSPMLYSAVYAYRDGHGFFSLITFLLLPVQYTAYGIGFLRGLIDF